jgi:ElaB/YqjD/DUF883 family membrane-anchored ribosome-binding protein
VFRAVSCNQHDDFRVAHRQFNKELAFMASTSSTSSGSIEDIKGRARQTMDAASEVAGDARQQVEEVAGNVKGAIDRSVKEQPLTTLLVAAAVGFVVGALWKS